MLLFGGVCRRRRAAAARLLPPTFGDTPALLIGCCCCHHDFKLRPPMLCFTVALASLFHAHCLCHCVAEVDGQGVTTGLACSAVGHFFDEDQKDLCYLNFAKLYICARNNSFLLMVAFYLASQLYIKVEKVFAIYNFFFFNTTAFILL